MKMNLPNKLTILRTVMIPFFILFLYTDWFHGYDKIIAAVIFIAASLTDMLDGKIARKYNLVTSQGSIIWLPTSVNLWIRWQISCWCVRRSLRWWI